MIAGRSKADTERAKPEKWKRALQRGLRAITPQIAVWGSCSVLKHSLVLACPLAQCSLLFPVSWGWLCHRGTLFLRRVSCPGLPFSPVLVPVVESCSTHAAISAAGPGSGQQRRNTLKKTLNPHQCGASPSSLSKDDSLF